MLARYRLPAGSLLARALALVQTDHHIGYSLTSLSLFSSSSDANQMQPLSKAISQLESVVLDKGLDPDTLSANISSMMALRAFLTGLSNPSSYPAASMKNLYFTVGSGQGARKVRCQLKTTGGDCSKLVQQRLGDLLQQCGISSNFYFDGREFKPVLKPLTPKIRKVIMPKSNPTTPPPSPDKVTAVRHQALAAGVPSQTITEEEFEKLDKDQTDLREAKAEADAQLDSLTADLDRLDPLFQACAGVPWLLSETDSVALEKARTVQAQVVDYLESNGWDIRGPLKRIWRGERDDEVLLEGKDGGTRAALKFILSHAKGYDKEHGRKTADL